MTFNSNIHRRRSIRLQGYDYSQAGAYFITICTQNRECMFGEIVGGKMALNHAGNMIQTVWDEIPIHYAGIETDEFVAMPNHIHTNPTQWESDRLNSGEGETVRPTMVREPVFSYPTEGWMV
jgi:REP element-mobilizing transposase RayT